MCCKLLGFMVGPQGPQEPLEPPRREDVPNKQFGEIFAVVLNAVQKIEINIQNAVNYEVIGPVQKTRKLRGFWPDGTPDFINYQVSGPQRFKSSKTGALQAQISEDWHGPCLNPRGLARSRLKSLRSGTLQAQILEAQCLPGPNHRNLARSRVKSSKPNAKSSKPGARQAQIFEAWRAPGLEAWRAPGQNRRSLARSRTKSSKPGALQGRSYPSEAVESNS